MNNLIVFVGGPGVGKTTFMNVNQQAITDTYGIVASLSSDAIVEDVALARGLTYTQVFKDSIDLATAYVDNMIGILSLQQRNFIIDKTNLTSKSRKRTLSKLVHPANYNKIAVVFNDVSPEERNARLIKRASEDGKHIPDEVLNRMLDSFEQPSLEEGFNRIFTIAEFKESLKKEEPKYGEQAFE